MNVRPVCGQCKITIMTHNKCAIAEYDSYTWTMEAREQEKRSTLIYLEQFLYFNLRLDCHCRFYLVSSPSDTSQK